MQSKKTTPRTATSATPRAAASAAPRAATPRAAAPAASRQRARRVQSGDVVLGNTAPANISKVASREAEAAAIARREAAIAHIVQNADDKLQTMQALLSRSSKDEIAALQRMLEQAQPSGKTSPDEELAPNWRKGGYPYKNLMSRRNYEKQKYLLQVELLKLQAWVKETGAKVVIVFEGRDAAGKGGSIKRFMEHLNPRGARVVALEKPTDEERGQWYFQRYVKTLPTSGEIVLFDRSWYNRAGVERVMGFCTDAEYREFML